MLTPEEAEGLVARAAERDSAAWEALVDAYAGVVWAVTRSYRMSSAEAADVSQTTWLRLVQYIDRLREPARVGAWLATTAKRECLDVIKRRGGEVAVADVAELPEREPPENAPEQHYLRRESISAMRAALHELPPRSRHLLELLAEDNGMDYQAVSSRLGMPIGSIGPTRARCLRKLELILQRAGVDGM